jgi:UDP-N-acetylmuramate--alanine ligase
VTGEALVSKIRAAGHARASYAGPVEDAARTILPSLKAGDLVLTLGAGNVTGVGPQLLELLRQREVTRENADVQA